MKNDKKPLQGETQCGKMLTVRNGWVACPRCGPNKNGRLMKIRSDTQGRKIVTYCRICKNEILIDINKGRAFESYKASD